jgi:glutamine amidotransferase
MFANDVQVVEELCEKNTATHLILPGVGAFGVVMQKINEKNLSGPLISFIESGRPLLGICVGMQVLFKAGYENGNHQGLGLFEGEVKSLSESYPISEIRVPHMGWTRIDQSNQEATKLFHGMQKSFHTYFAHSYEVETSESDSVSSYMQLSTGRIITSIERKNLFGVQFHPEKSGNTGLSIFRNFLNIRAQ